MEIKWLGTAGFEFKTGHEVFLVDPFLSRNPNAVPEQSLSLDDIEKASQIFISHGHFDHIQDIPPIALRTNADIYCSSVAAGWLENRRVRPQQIVPVPASEKTFKFQNYHAQAFFHAHVRFDLKLIMTTLWRIKGQAFKYLSLFRGFPCGQVLSWRFRVENKTILFFGSAGASRGSLKQMGKRPVDILLFPFQGHSDICRIGLAHVRWFRPKIVIPHHHDDFYPPLSKAVDIRPFVDAIKKDHKETRVMVPEMNQALVF